MPNNTDRALETKLPYGQELTDLLVQNYISESNVSSLLQLKGVFYGRRDKKYSIPLVSSMLLTPEEFEYIKDKRNSKEDRLKHRSSALPWSSDKTLFAELPKDLDVRSLVDTEFKGYKILGDPSFVPCPSNQNKVTMDFEIDRVDNTKNWCNSNRRFKGAVELEVKEEILEARFVIYNTSSETEEVGNKIVAHIKKDFATRGCTADRPLDVAFSAFSNEQRIAFFWKLTGDIRSGMMTFEGISDIDIKPDDSMPIPPALDIQWMENNVKKLHISGDSIHETFFIKDKKCHPHLIIWRMESKYTFDDHVGKGRCRLSFEFAGAKANSELAIAVSQLALSKDHSHVSKTKVEKHLLEQIDQLKISLFKKFDEKENKAENGTGR